MSRPLPSLSPDTPREAPIAAWLHRGQYSQPTVAVTFPGTHKAMSLTRMQITRLRKALEIAEAELARNDTAENHSSIDLMKRISP